MRIYKMRLLGTRFTELAREHGIYTRMRPAGIQYYESKD
jgi:hypothetical protein